MNDKAIVNKLKDIAAQAAALAMAVGEVHGPTGSTVLDRIRQAEPGIRAASYDNARRSGGVSDPVGRETATSVDDGGERTASVRAEVEQLIARLMRSDDVDRLWRLIEANGPPRRPSDADKLALARANEKGKPGCESCARIKSADDPREPYWQEVHPDLPDGTTAICKTAVAGDRRTLGLPRLAERMALCVWCYRFVCRQWRLPTLKELEARQDDRKVMLPAGEEQAVRARILGRIIEHAQAQAETAAAYEAETAGHEPEERAAS